MVARYVRAISFIPCLMLATAVWSAEWNQFRGPERDAVSDEKGLLRSWPESGPRVLWSTAVAQGYAAPSVYAGKVYLNDYDETRSEFLVRCLDLADGREKWRFAERRRIRPNHAITRTVAATDGRYVFSLDPKAVLHALDAETGAEVWRINLVRRYGSKIPPWYNGQNPLVEEDRVLVAPAGGDALVVALDKATGAEIWRTPNPSGLTLSHASLMPARLAGVDQYLFSVLQGTVGVDASDGKLLWHFPFKFNLSVSPSPLAVGDGRVYITGGYDSGGAMFRVGRKGDLFTTETIFVHPPDQWNSEVQTPVFFDGHFFGVGKKRRGMFTCLDLDGSEVWNSDGKAHFGLGSFILADGMFFILEGKTGMLRLLEANTVEYRELASAQILSGHDVWAPLTLSDGKLLVRDLKRLVCLEVR
jgi:outer membrane protein assembly factor BamB